MSPDIVAARDALHIARLMRAEYLLGVNDAVLTIDDVIRSSRQPARSPLRRIQLRQLLMAQTGTGPKGADLTIERMFDLLELRRPPKRPTIAWLLDERAGGVRLRAFLDARTTSSEPPWPQWPYETTRGKSQ
ncbi:hypothetical protein F8O07_06835 [Pseudoclavibacter sp. CFCC 13796]|uniref:hypothetical protein n=1 Tax=Pseudoclavibacter sp. CFCC 13796 TaxID=2615179 RepID=UPI0013011E92|nr:hypothetical protein [Pseudoclavibacter sp. CFCC 13796]KAB1661614.1 hypothetical protein F8O07_06835 [Pseudoclavibacter sp. CFCC 13796]